MKSEVVKKLIALPNADLTLIGAINSLGFQPHFHRKSCLLLRHPTPFSPN